MKKVKKLTTSFLLSCMILLFSAAPAVFAENDSAETGWIEVNVSVPENFNDQIYVQFQNVDNIEDAFYGNTVQILPENGYVGRINLPVGTYEITMKTVFENPLLYNLELDTETEYPIVVTTESTASLVKLECKTVPMDDLSALEGKIPQEILDAANEIIEANEEQEDTTTTEEMNETISDSSINEDSSTETEKGPLYRIVMGLIETIIFVGIIGIIGFILYKCKAKFF